MRVLLLACAVLLSGCVNLPASLEREFECPAAGGGGHFGSREQCAAGSAR